jgi:nucleoside phosphorylase
MVDESNKMKGKKYIILSRAYNYSAPTNESRYLMHDDYMVGWVVVLPSELGASGLLLDEEHRRLQPREDDNNSYLLGRMGEHNVVIASPKFGTYAQAVPNLLRTFRNIRFGLLVGVGGGAPRSPNPEDASRDIRLGDVVVSNPKGSHGKYSHCSEFIILSFYAERHLGGVLQYDMGKWRNDRKFDIMSHLDKPPMILLKAVQLLQSDHKSGEGKTNQYIRDVTVKSSAPKTYQFPGQDRDQLFKASYGHIAGYDCSACNATMTEKRLDRESDGPAIHYGLIASANMTMRSAQRRDELRDILDVSCFETKAAGLMDNFPCIVIRGICDYSDDHGNEVWHPYAAVAAAAYAKDLLRIIKPKEVETIPPVVAITGFPKSRSTNDGDTILAERTSDGTEMTSDRQDVLLELDQLRAAVENLSCRLEQLALSQTRMYLPHGAVGGPTLYSTPQGIQKHGRIRPV